MNIGLYIKVTPQEKKAWAKFAEIYGKNTSVMVRDTMNALILGKIEYPSPSPIKDVQDFVEAQQ